MAVVSEMEFGWIKELKEFDDSKMGVKTLVDNGITTIPRIFHHPPESLSDLKPLACSSDLGIPIIDLSGLNSPDQRFKIVDQVRESCRTWGFFHVINHGISLEEINETIDAVRSYHEQPMEIKMEDHGMDKKVSFYTNPNISKSKAVNWKDSMRVLMAPGPPELESIPMVCRKEMVAWEKHTMRLTETLMEVVCEGLGVNPSRLKDLSCLDARKMSTHFYPYCPEPELTLGINPHSDRHILTLLLRSQNSCGGLQVKHGQGWVNADPVPGGITVNVGDLLQILSNDEYKSVVHRVLANPSRDPRISIGVFFSPGKNGETDYYGPLPELLSPEKPPLYRNFTMPEIHKQAQIIDACVKELVDSFKLGDTTKEGA